MGMKGNGARYLNYKSQRCSQRGQTSRVRDGPPQCRGLSFLIKSSLTCAPPPSPAACPCPTRGCVKSPGLRWSRNHQRQEGVQGGPIRRESSTADPPRNPEPPSPPSPPHAGALTLWSGEMRATLSRKREEVGGGGRRWEDGKRRPLCSQRSTRLLILWREPGGEELGRKVKVHHSHF